MLSSQVNNQNERSPAVHAVLESTYSGCSSGASQNLDTGRDASGTQRVVPSPPALPSCVPTVLQPRHSLPFGAAIGASVDNQQWLMAAQQFQSQQLQLHAQANAQRISEARLDGVSMGASVGGPNLTAACKQSSSSSFNGSPITYASAAIEAREEPMHPSAPAADTGMAANRVLRLVQQRGQRQDRCPTPQMHHLMSQAHPHQSDEEVASQQQQQQQQGGRVLPPLRLDNADEAGTGGAGANGGGLVSYIETSGLDTAAGAADAHDPNQLAPPGRVTGPDGSMAILNNPELSGRLSASANRQDTAALPSGATAAHVQRGPQLQQPQHLTGMHAPLRVHPCAGATSTAAMLATAPGGAGGAVSAGPAAQAQLRQLQLQQQLQLRQRLHHQQLLQQQQLQADAQSAQQAQTQGQGPLGPSASLSSSAMGGAADRVAAAGMEAQVRARLGLPPKRGTPNPAGGTGMGLGSLGSAGGGSPSLASMGPLATASSDTRIGPESLGAARMRLMAAAGAAGVHVQSSQTSSPSISCSASQASVAAGRQLHTSGSAPHEAASGMGMAVAVGQVAAGGGSGCDLLLGSSPAILPSQQQAQQHPARRQQELFISQQQQQLLQQQQRLSVRQALLRGSPSTASSASAVTQSGGPFAVAAGTAAALGSAAVAPALERACSAPQAALETQVAAARLRRLEQMGISPSQAVLAVAASGRFPGAQPQLTCRTSVGYVTAGVAAAAGSNPPSETGSPLSGRSFKRSAPERCWEEQQQQQQLLLQTQQQLVQQQQQQQQQAQAQGLIGLVPHGGAATVTMSRQSGLAAGGLGMGAGPGGMAGLPGGGEAAQQAMKRGRGFGTEALSPAGRAFASQSMQRFDPGAAAAAPQQLHYQQHPVGLMCRSLPEDIHTAAMLAGAQGGFPGGGAYASLQQGMSSSSTGMQLPSQMGNRLPRAGLCGPQDGMGSSLEPLDGPGGMGMGMAGLGGGMVGPMSAGGGLGVLSSSGGGGIYGGGGMGVGMGMIPTGGAGMGVGPMSAGGAGGVMGMGAGLAPGAAGMWVGGDGGGALVSGGGARVSTGPGGLGGGDGLGPPPMVPRNSGFDTAMELADLGPDTDYLADTELQSFIAELCAPASATGQPDPLSSGGAEAAGLTDVPMAEGMGNGAGPGASAAMTGSRSAGTESELSGGAADGAAAAAHYSGLFSVPASRRLGRCVPFCGRPSQAPLAASWGLSHRLLCRPLTCTGRWGAGCRWAGAAFGFEILLRKQDLGVLYLGRSGGASVPSERARAVAGLDPCSRGRGGAGGWALKKRTVGVGAVRICGGGVHPLDVGGHVKVYARGSCNSSSSSSNTSASCCVPFLCGGSSLSESTHKHELAHTRSRAEQVRQSAM